MDKLFDRVPVEITVDDFMMHGEDETDIDPRRVLDSIREVKLRVPKVRNVGPVFSGDGLRADPD